MSRDLNFSHEILMFIDNTQNLCRISDLLRYSLRNPERILKFEGDFIKENPQSCDTISFVPKSKLTGCDGFNEVKHRTTIKIGRFVNKFFKKEAIKEFCISDYEIESFVNVYKSYFSTDSNNFKIVEGEEIKKWYLQDNYFTPNGCKYGTLWNSCMRYQEKNEFMQIYAANPGRVKMLINLDEDGRLKTRALIWDEAVTTSGEKYKIMDRIYSIYDHEINTFKKWAEDNGYIYKYEQSARTERLFKTPGGLKDLQLKIQLDTWKVSKYPFIDTFKFIDYRNGILSNSDNFRYDYILVQNDGALERYDEEPEPEEVYDDDF